ncbi:hypothetical protein JVU11DRAFT_84 [Chiua virens]|nr:hypothetical protein JVU11DRAFT_84 [Chiua virens]
MYKDLHKSNEGCKLLLQRTVLALKEEALQMLLVTTQHTNIMLCIEYALRRALIPFICYTHEQRQPLTDAKQQELVGAIASWFPYFEVCNFL